MKLIITLMLLIGVGYVAHCFVKARSYSIPQFTQEEMEWICIEEEICN